MIVRSVFLPALREFNINLPNIMSTVSDKSIFEISEEPQQEGAVADSDQL